MHRKLFNHKLAHQRGFSMVEIIVVVGIVAILTSLALPSFQPLVERWRNRTAVEELKSSLYLARSEAIKRGGNVVLARNATLGTCTSTGNDDWKCGWTLYHDANRDGNQAACTNADPTECPIQISNVPPNTLLVVAPTDAGRLFMNSSGRISNQSGAVINNVSMDILDKNRNIADLGSLRLCIGGPGKYRQVKGSESC